MPSKERNERDEALEYARRELSSFLIDLKQKYQLTACERLAFLSDELNILSHRCMHREHSELYPDKE